MKSRAERVKHRVKSILNTQGEFFEKDLTELFLDDINHYNPLSLRDLNQQDCIEVFKIFSDFAIEQIEKIKKLELYSKVNKDVLEQMLQYQKRLIVSENELMSLKMKEPELEKHLITLTGLTFNV